ncbi:hypothetical protein IF1G_11353 [Cordyceps javanica]|uniref:Uncharacterized protein n=1 Tax=Cordyceps javanica TaxID=43265 RepID=A0A545UKJ1_9HYPO|nr:hypothetical protein IF1G_11353 [Cordyceps javanica]
MHTTPPTSPFDPDLREIEFEQFVTELASDMLDGMYSPLSQHEENICELNALQNQLLASAHVRRSEIEYAIDLMGAEYLDQGKAIEFSSSGRESVDRTKLSTNRKRGSIDMSESWDMTNEGNTRPNTAASSSRQQRSEASSREANLATKTVSPSTACPYEFSSNSGSQRYFRESILTWPSITSPMVDSAAERILLSPKKNPYRVEHEHAVMSAAVTVRGIASEGVLQARQRILQTRECSANNIAKHINEIRDHLEHLCFDSHLKSLVDRVRYLLIAAYYNECRQANGGLGGRAIISRSLQVFFTEVWFPEWVEELRKTKKHNAHNSMKGKWKARLRIGRFWKMLSSKYGSGIIWIFSERN